AVGQQTQPQPILTQRFRPRDHGRTNVPVVVVFEGAIHVQEQARSALLMQPRCGQLENVVEEEVGRYQTEHRATLETPTLYAGRSSFAPPGGYPPPPPNAPPSTRRTQTTRRRPYTSRGRARPL